MVQQLSGLSTQRGASVTSIVFIIIALGVAVKLIVAIVPAQIGDYQLTETLKRSKESTLEAWKKVVPVKADAAQADTDAKLKS